MHSKDQLEIRLLGSTLVRRRDGEAVPPKEWRTAKSLELVRLLAVHHDQSVPTDVAIEHLWPHADAKKAQASLRTATYHARLALGEDAVERRSDGLALVNAWTDVHAYAMLAGEIEAARRLGDHLRVALLAREAQALYVDDLDTEGAGDWLLSAQRDWREIRLRVLLAASESAVALGRMREARDLATGALRIEPSSEVAVRIVMRAFGALGEIEKALSAYERLREELRDGYGADPAPQTRALHLQLLTSTAADRDDRQVPDEEVVGHDDALDSLTAVLLHLGGSADGRRQPGVVWVLGDAGTGRDTLITVACSRARLTMCETRCGALNIADQQPPGRPDLPERGVLVAPAEASLTAEDVTRLRAWAEATESLLIVPASPMAPEVLAAALEDVGTPVAPVVHLESLDRTAVERLLKLLLQASAAPALVDAVLERTGGRSGEICATALRWLRAGRVLWTPEGMALSAELDSSPAFPTSTSRLVKALRALDFRTLEALSVVAAVPRGATSRDVDAVLSRLRPPHRLDAQELLDRLVDSGVLRTTSRRYHLRNEDDRAEIFAWLRPATLRKVHSAVAQAIGPDSGARIEHLAAQGQHGLAHDLGVDAVMEACQQGDFDRARALVDVLDAKASARGRVGVLASAASRWVVAFQLLLWDISPVSIEAAAPTLFV